MHGPYDHRPSHPYDAGTENEGFSPPTQALRAPSAAVGGKEASPSPYALHILVSHPYFLRRKPQRRRGGVGGLRCIRGEARGAVMYRQAVPQSARKKSHVRATCHTTARSRSTQKHEGSLMILDKSLLVLMLAARPHPPPRPSGLSQRRKTKNCRVKPKTKLPPTSKISPSQNVFFRVIKQKQTKPFPRPITTKPNMSRLKKKKKKNENVSTVIYRPFPCLRASSLACSCPLSSSSTASAAAVTAATAVRPPLLSPRPLLEDETSPCCAASPSWLSSAWRLRYLPEKVRASKRKRSHPKAQAIAGICEQG